MNLNEAMKETTKVATEMVSQGAKEWDNKTRFIALVEEIGELAHAILLDHQEKPEHRRRSIVVDSLCDALFMIFRLADEYDIDLDKKYQELLNQINRRYKDGKFVKNYGLQEDKRN
jgi:NTP pyrophosphatase (non-canonical NTP hydrolase)